MGYTIKDGVITFSNGMAFKLEPGMVDAQGNLSPQWKAEADKIVGQIAESQKPMGKETSVTLDALSDLLGNIDVPMAKTASAGLSAASGVFDPENRGVIGGTAGGVFGELIKRHPIGLALGGVRKILPSLFTGLGEGAGELSEGKPVGEAATQAAKATAFAAGGEALFGFAAPKVAKGAERLGHFMEKRALSPSADVIKTTRIPGKPNASSDEKTTFLYDEIRKLGTPPIGGRAAVRANEAGTTRAVARQQAAIAADPRTVPPVDIAKAGAEYGLSEGHAAGNYPRMVDTINDVITGMREDPLLGRTESVNLPPIARLKLPQGITEANWNAMDPHNALKQLYMKEGYGPFMEPVTEQVRAFKPEVDVPTLWNVKHQTGEEVSPLFKAGAEITEPNRATVQKGSNRFMADFLHENPAIQSADKELFTRATIRPALDAAQQRSAMKGLSYTEGVGAVAALASLLAGATPATATIPVGLAILAQRPAIQGSLGRGLQISAPKVGEAASSVAPNISNAMRLAWTLAQNRGGQ